MTWHLFGHVADLAQDDGFLCMTVGVDSDIVALRDNAGEIWAFDNVCPHRGARIFSPGRNAGKPICAYHGRHVSPFTPGVKRLPVMEVCGWLIIGDDPTRDALNLPPWAGELAKLGDQHDLALASVQQMLYPCHWTVAIENALDFDHVSTVHSKNLGKLGLRSTFVGTFADGGSVETFEATEKGQIDLMVKHFDRAALIDYLHIHAAPFACLATTRGATFSLQTYYPRPDGTTAFLTRLYARPGVTKHAQMVVEQISKFNGQVFEEDGYICSRVRPGYPGRLDKHERRIAHFRASLRADV